MSKLIGQRTSEEGCHITLIDHTTPHSNIVHHEIILQTNPMRNVKPIKLRTEEWDKE